jgi:hypothetical protein
MATVQASPKSDAYTVLLSISLGALVIGCVLLFMDWSEYSGTTGKKPPIPSPPSIQAGGDQGAMGGMGGAQPVTPTPPAGQTPPAENK